MFVSSTAYLTDDEVLAARALRVSEKTGTYVPIIPLAPFAAYPRDLKVYLENLRSRVPLEHLVFEDDAPAELIDGLATALGTRSLMRFSEIQVPPTLEAEPFSRSPEPGSPAVAYEAGDGHGQVLARNYANARGLSLLEIEPPTADEQSAVNEAVRNSGWTTARAGDVLSQVLERSLPAELSRLTIVSSDIFPYHLRYPNIPVAVLPRSLAWRIMLEEIVLSLYGRPSVLGVAVDATAAPASRLLVSEIPDLVPNLEDRGMRFTLLPAETNADLFGVMLNQFPFDLMLIAAHSVSVSSRTCRYAFDGATGSHLVDVEEQAATNQKRTKFLAIDDRPLREVDEAVKNDMRIAFEAKAFTLLSSHELSFAGDEALQLPNGDTHLGFCRIGPGRTLPVIFGNFCGSRTFGRNALGGGAGGFAGTLWPISDMSARAVAKEFVRKACAGETFAEAMFNARREAADSRSAKAYQYLGSAEHSLGLAGIERVAALRHIVNKLYEVVSSYARHAPFDRLPEEFKAGLALVLPRLNAAMELLAAAAQDQIPFILWLRAELCSTAVQTGTPAAFFEEELKRIETEVRIQIAEHGQDELLLRALVSVGAVAFLKGAVTRGLGLIDEAIAGLESLSADGTTLASSYATKGNCLFVTARLDEADLAFARAQTILQEAGNRAGAATLLSRRASCALRAQGADIPQRELDSIEQDLDSIASLAIQQGDTDALTTVIETQAFIARHRSDYASAAAYGQRLKELLRTELSERALVPASYNLASDLGRLGEFDRAEEEASAAVELARAIGDERELMMALNNRAVIRLASGDDKAAWADVGELGTLNWPEHPELAVRVQHWAVLQAQAAGDHDGAKTALERLQAQDALPPGIEFSATLSLLRLYAREHHFPPADELLRLTEQLLDASLRAGSEEEILPLTDRYLQMKVDDADVHTALVIRLARARLSSEGGDQLGLANARFIAAIQAVNDEDTQDGIDLILGAWELYASLDEYLPAFISGVLAGHLLVWYSKNGGDVDYWVAGLQMFEQAWGLWSTHLRGAEEQRDNAWSPFLGQLFETLCLGLVLALNPDGAIGARTAVLALASETNAARVAARLPSEEEIREEIAQLKHELESASH